MENDRIQEIFRAGCFPVLSGPDQLALALGLVEPVVMGTVREVSFRIQASRDGSSVAAARGPVVGMGWGNGNGFYDVVVRHFDGDYASIKGYNPLRGHCRALAWANGREDVARSWRDRPTNRVATWNLNRDGLLKAIIEMRLVPWPDSKRPFTVDLGSAGRHVELTSPDSPDFTYTAPHGTIHGGLTDVIRDPASGELYIQLTDPRGIVFHGMVDADLQLQWIHLGWGWRSASERRAS